MDAAPPATPTATTGTGASSYTSDADGMRRSQTVGTGPTTDCAYDGQSMLREMQVGTGGSLASAATYLTGPRGPNTARS